MEESFKQRVVPPILVKNQLLKTFDQYRGHYHTLKRLAVLVR